MSKWVVGWTTGGAVVAVAAGLLVTNIALGRRIVRQAREIEDALDGARRHTAPIFELSAANAALERATRELRSLR